MEIYGLQNRRTRQYFYFTNQQIALANLALAYASPIEVRGDSYYVKGRLVASGFAYSVIDKLIPELFRKLEKNNEQIN